MVNKKLIFLFAFVFLLLVAPLVQSAPPVTTTQQFTTGYEIRTPQDTDLRVGQDYEFEFHVFNISNGVPIRSGISCYFHLYDRSGEHLLVTSDSSADTIFDYGFFVNGSNFSYAGDYYYNIQCNSSSLGGFHSQLIQTTNSGIIPTTSQGIVYSLLLITSIIIMILCFSFSFIINGENKYTMGGDLIEININKYFKIFLFFIGYLFAILSSFLAWQVAFQFLMLDFGSMVFKFIFTTLWILLIPIFVLVVIMGIMKWLFDLQLQKLMERGLKQR